MRQVIYRPDRFSANLRHEETLEVRRLPNSEPYTISAYDAGDGTLYNAHLSQDQALRLAAYILATHPEAAGRDDFEGIAFAPTTASCEELPRPDFVVLPAAPAADYKAEVNGTLPPDRRDIPWYSFRPEQEPRPSAPDAAEPEDLGLLHPDQDRRLTALREAREILGRYVPGGHVLKLAEWILTGTAATSAAEGGEQA